MGNTQDATYYIAILYIVMTVLSSFYFVYCLYRFISTSRLNSDDKFFRHRHSMSNNLFLICFFVASFIINPLEVILNINISYLSDHGSILDILDNITSILIFSIFICRIWLLFSDWSFHNNMKSWIWKREIDPLHSNYIIKYRRIFGNSTYCFLLLFFILFIPIIFILDIIPYFIFNNNSTNESNIILFRIFIILFLVIFTLSVLLFRLRRILDVYYIRKELLIEMCIYGLLLLLSQIITNPDVLMDKDIQILIRSLLSTITGICVIYVGTNWVLTKYSAYKLFQQIGSNVVNMKNINKAKHQIVYSNDSIDMDNDTDDITVAVAQDNHNKELIEILNSKKGFESFLYHLVNELQLEQMLFIIELLQFKQEIKLRLAKLKPQDDPNDTYKSSNWLKWNYVVNDVRSDTEKIDFDIDLLLLTEIDIKSLDLPKDPRMIGWSIYQFSIHLYDKYIEDGASLQLNLSSECKRFIYSYFQNRLIAPDTTPFATPNRSKMNLKKIQQDDGFEIVLQDEKLLFNMDKLDNDNDDNDDDDDDDDDDNDKYRVKSNSNYVPEDSPVIQSNDGIKHEDDRNISMVYDLFRLYDNAGIIIWKSISSGVFNRFKSTNEYATIHEK